MLDKAVNLVTQADIILIIGTSLQVYPAASLFQFAKEGAPIFYIDPKPASTIPSNINVIKKGASEGLQDFIEAIKSL